MHAAWYPKADRGQDKTQFAGHNPDGSLFKMPRISKALLHSTETQGWPGYPTFAPQFTYDPWRHQWRQHMPLPCSASTLADPSWTMIRENRDEIVQVEIVGYCDPNRWDTGKNVEKMDAQALADLGAFIAWLHAEWEVPLDAIPPAQWVSYPKSFGLKASQRLSESEFDKFQGVLGHQHACGNAHGDPGHLDILAIMDAAGGSTQQTVRVVSQNFRKSNIIETVASRHWDSRLPYMVEHLKKANPAVVGAQEATVAQCADIMSAFPNWTYVGGVKFGNCPIFWDTQILQAEEGTLLEKKYPSGERERYATLVRLQHRQLDWGGWFGSIHLAANGLDEPDSAELRATQMRWIVADFTAWINAHPHPEDSKPNLIVCGDLNDNLGDDAGVRKIAYDRGGWKPLRKRLPAEKISGRTLRSFNGWKATSSLPHDSKPIDEIFTSGVTLEDAALRRTCTDVLQLHASDHNGYQADIIV